MIGRNPRAQEAGEAQRRNTLGDRPARRGGPDDGDVAMAPPRRPAPNPPATQNVTGQAPRENMTGQLHATGAAPNPRAEAAGRVRMPTRFQDNVQTQAAPRLSNPSLVSVQDGKIGSFYFNGGRVRTVHQGGPGVLNDLPGSTTRKFELDKTQMFDAFEQAKPDLVRPVRAEVEEEVRTWGLSEQEEQYMLEKSLKKEMDSWVAKQLYSAELFQRPIPQWATPETRLAETPQMDVRERIPTDRLMFEVSDSFQDGQIILQNHMSRGVLRQIPMTDRDISAVQTASAQIDPNMPAAEANQEFYDTVASISPQLAELLRSPEDVRTVDRPPPNYF